MAHPIRDVYTFEQFDSMAEFNDSLKNNSISKLKPGKQVKIKGKRTLGIKLQNKVIFVKLDFSKILKEQNLKQIDTQQRNFHTFKVRNNRGRNEPSCFVSIDDSGGKYTIQSVLFVKDKGAESEKILFVTTVLDMENRIKEIGRSRRPAHRKAKRRSTKSQSRQSDDDWDDDDWDDDDDWYAGEGYGGRTPADDRSDSMNPESDRYNPTSRR